MIKLKSINPPQWCSRSALNCTAVVYIVYWPLNAKGLQYRYWKVPIKSLFTNMKMKSAKEALPSFVNNSEHPVKHFLYNGLLMTTEHNYFRFSFNLLWKKFTVLIAIHVHAIRRAFLKSKSKIYYIAVQMNVDDMYYYFLAK